MSLCHLSPAAMSRPPAPTPHRSPPHAASRHWPVAPRAKLRLPRLANWPFVLAHSVVMRSKNEMWRRYYGGWLEEWQVKAKRGKAFFVLYFFFKAPDALPASIMMPYGGSRLFRRSNYEDKKARWRLAEMESHTSTYIHANADDHERAS